MTKAIEAVISLEAPLIGRVGPDRIALLEAIGQMGSISAAARRVGLSYRAAWDAVQVLNKMFGVALVSANPGGGAGGGAELTRHGYVAVAEFREMQAQLDVMLERMQRRVLKR